MLLIPVDGRGTGRLDYFTCVTCPGSVLRSHEVYSELLGRTLQRTVLNRPGMPWSPTLTALRTGSTQPALRWTGELLCWCMSQANPLDPQKGAFPASGEAGEWKAEQCPDILEVVEVVELWRWQEGQVVATVRNACCYKSNGEPCWDWNNVRSHDHRASHDRQSVGDLEMRRKYLINGSTTSRPSSRSWIITWSSITLVCFVQTV